MTTKKFLGGALLFGAAVCSLLSMRPPPKPSEEPEPEPELEAEEEEHEFLFVIYTGESLFDMESEPIEVVFDADFYLGIMTSDMDAWGCLLSIIMVES